MTPVFVTGGAGFVGSHTTKALRNCGFEPIVLDNLSRGNADAVKWGVLEVVDLADRDRLLTLFTQYRPAAVLHFAAFAYVGESVSDPYLYYRNNVAGTLSLLEVMCSTSCDKIVFSSTCATYGAPETLPIREDTRQAPLNPYGHSKLVVEHLLRQADDAYGLKSIALRYFNAAGSDPDCEIGERHDPETHLIPLVLRAAANPDAPVTVFGDDYDTPDGTCVRDYVHVCDLADAHVLALDWLLQGHSSDVFNLGNGSGFSVRDVIDTAERVTGLKVAYNMGPRRHGDPPILVSDASKALTVLGWKPRRTQLATQMEDAWNWYRHDTLMVET